MADVLPFPQRPPSWPLHGWQLGRGQPPGPDGPAAMVERTLDVIHAAQRGLYDFTGPLVVRTARELAAAEAWLLEYRAAGYDRQKVTAREPDWSVWEDWARMVQ